MRIVLQRVSQASVSVGDQTIAQIGPGLLLLVGVSSSDQPDQARYLAEKIAHLRIFRDSEQKFNLSLIDVKGGMLVVSQFTLLGDCRKRRWESGANPGPAADGTALSWGRVGDQPVGNRLESILIVRDELQARFLEGQDVLG